jgi:KaiC/GvpD/RAD55 family RecA-like ATPase
MQDKISTGISGLDALIIGGIRRKTTSVVIGSSGTGKTIFCLQFLLEGLINGENAIYITLEEMPAQLIKEAKLLGFPEIEEFTDTGQLLFIPCTSENFKKFIKESLPKLIISYRKMKEDINVRIAVDPLTPMMWALTDKSAQRALIHSLFYQMRSLGTIIATIEQHTRAKEFIIDKAVTIPIFLADYAFMFQYLGLGGEYDRGLRVVKSRGSNHSYGVFPVHIVKGWGLVVVSPEPEKIDNKDAITLFDQAIELVKKWNGARKDILLKKFQWCKKHWDYSKSPADIIEVILREYRIVEKLDDSINL